LVSFTYDPIGRRVSKTFDQKTVKFLWDGDKIIHEWNAKEEKPKVYAWLFEEGEFTPLAKLTKEKAYSVISDHLGTPNALLDQDGESVWKASFDLYGKARVQEGGLTEEEDCLFRFPGQYEDEETGLYYNRFRYYDPSAGQYTQRDPIGLAGGNPTVYGYVWSTLIQFDPFGLAPTNPIDRKIIAEFLGSLKNKGGVYMFPDVQTGGGAWYIGKTNDFYRRLTDHLRSGKLDPSVLDRIAISYNPNATSIADLFKAESNTIAEFKKQGVPLSNKINSPGLKLNSMANKTNSPGVKPNSMANKANSSIKKPAGVRCG
jgi:RHS repeat-associated protein